MYRAPAGAHPKPGRLSRPGFSFFRAWRAGVAKRGVTPELHARCGCGDAGGRSREAIRHPCSIDADEGSLPTQGKRERAAGE